MVVCVRKIGKSAAARLLKRNAPFAQTERFVNILPDFVLKRTREYGEIQAGLRAQYGRHERYDLEAVNTHPLR